MTLKKILKKVKKIDINTNNKINSLFAGNYRSVFFGRGVEFADLRPYDFGDDVRDIDWKSTAKQGELFIKKYNESRNNTLFFVIDVSLTMNFSSQKEKKFENLLETFAILAFAAIKNGDKVGVIFSGKGNAKIFPPKKGRRNVLKILSTALEIYESKSNKIETFNLEKDLKLVQKILKHSSVVFWLSGSILNLKKNENLTKIIKTISLKHDFIPIVFSDPEERNLTIRGNFNFQDSVTGNINYILITDKVAKYYHNLYQDKKKNFLLFFRKYRMESIFIDSSENIFLEIFTFFKKRQRHTI